MNQIHIPGIIRNRSKGLRKTCPVAYLHSANATVGRHEGVFGYINLAFVVSQSGAPASSHVDAGPVLHRRRFYRSASQFIDCLRMNVHTGDKWGARRFSRCPPIYHLWKGVAGYAEKCSISASSSLPEPKRCVSVAGSPVSSSACLMAARASCSLRRCVMSERPTTLAGR